MSRIPKNAVNIAEFTAIPDSQKQARASGGSIYTVLKDGQEWIVKEFANPLLAQIEAATSSFARLFLPDTVAEIRPVYRLDDNNNPVFFATVSKKFTNFVSLQDYLNAAPDYDKAMEFLLDHGLSEVLAISYLLENDDLHKGNIGLADINGKKRVVLIDLDMAAFSIIGHPMLRGPRGLVQSTHVGNFEITVEDIQRFPVLTKANFYYWPTVFRNVTLQHGYTMADTQAFAELEKTATNRDNASLLFLKYALMPDDLISAAFSDNIDSDAKYGADSSVSLLRLFQSAFCEKRKKVRDALLSVTTVPLMLNQFQLEHAKTLKAIFDASGLQPGSLAAIESNYYLFVRDLTAHHFAALINDLVTTAATPEDDAKKAAFMQGLHYIFTAYESYSQKMVLTPQDVSEFVQSLSNAQHSSAQIVRKIFRSPCLRPVDATVLTDPRIIRMIAEHSASFIIYINAWAPKFPLIEPRPMVDPWTHVGKVPDTQIANAMTLWLAAMDSVGTIPDRLGDRRTIIDTVRTIVSKIREAEVSDTSRSVTAQAMDYVSWGFSAFWATPEVKKPKSQSQILQDMLDAIEYPHEENQLSDFLKKVFSMDAFQPYKLDLIKQILALFITDFLNKPMFERIESSVAITGYFLMLRGSVMPPEDLSAVINTCFLVIANTVTTEEEKGFVSVNNFAALIPHASL